MNKCVSIHKRVVKEKVSNPAAVGKSPESDTPAEIAYRICGEDAPYIRGGDSICLECLQGEIGSQLTWE